VIARAREPDLALVRIPTRDLMPGNLAALRPASMAPMEKDFAALSCGVQAGQPPNCSVETVLGKKLIRKPGGAMSHIWEINREPASGRSGGPLIDKRGSVIGILSGRNDGKGLLHPPSTRFTRFLKGNEAGRVLLDPKD